MMTRPHFAFLDNGGEVKAFAHRGGDLAGAEKENSMAAFEAAYNAGFTYLETDVISSADGYVLATHGSKDEKARQKTGLPLRTELEAMEYQEVLDTIRIGDEPIPLLADILYTFPEARVNIDAKTEKVVRPLADLLLDFDAVDRVYIASFSYERTQGVAELLGGQDRVCTAAAMLGTVAAKAGIPIISGRHLGNLEAACLQTPFRYDDLLGRSHAATDRSRKLTTRHVVERAQEAGLEVHVWTVNDRDSMQDAVNIGVDGVMSDNLTDLKEVIWLP